jgi:succinylglutamate desuccinylase
MMTENQLYQRIQNPVERVLGSYPLEESSEKTLLISTGIHGNEPSGIIAFQNVVRCLEKEQPSFNGKLIGIAGNLTAIKAGVRMIDHDLNRLFTLETVHNIENKTTNLQEEKDVEEILQFLHPYEQGESMQSLFYMDLHTTSSPTQPFISVKNGENSINFAQKFPLPMVIGIEKYIPGNFDQFMASKGHLGFTVEAGQHDSEDAVKYHEAMIWWALNATGMIEKNSISDWDQKVNIITSSSLESGNYEVIFKYELRSGEDFKMEAGYKNFQPIKNGEILAYSDGRPVVSKWEARIFMPLYQSQGKDGFFIVEEISQ